LVVDDGDLTVKLLTKRLAAKNYQVVSAATGQQARKLVVSEKPDLILMDIMLPDVDGSQVVRGLQDNPYTRRIPVIFLSSIIDGQQNTGEQQVKVGSLAYAAVGKPIPMEKLLEKVQAALAAT